MSVAKISSEKKKKEKNNSDERRSSVFANGNSSDVENFVEKPKPHFELADKENSDSANSDEHRNQEYTTLIGKIRLYFITNQRLDDAEAFIAYNEKRQWEGINGESVKENFQKYAKGWLDQGEEFYK